MREGDLHMFCTDFVRNSYTTTTRSRKLGASKVERPQNKLAPICTDFAHVFCAVQRLFTLFHVNWPKNGLPT